MKNVIKLSLIATTIIIAFAVNTKLINSEQEIMYELSVSTNMNYGTVGTIVFGGQPNEDELIDIIKAGAKTIVRMNRNGKDSGGMTIEEEAKICDNNGARLLFINAHMGYEEGRGYVKSGELISSIMSDGNVFLHCCHGFDRTGHIMVVYLKKYLRWSMSRIIIFIGWETYLQDKKEGDYYKYYESLNY